MAILSDRERKELLQDACSMERRRDFRQIDVIGVPLSPSEFIEFLTWANRLHDARARTHETIKGDNFLI